MQSSNHETIMEESSARTVLARRSGTGIEAFPLDNGSTNSSTTDVRDQKSSEVSADQQIPSSRRVQKSSTEKIKRDLADHTFGLRLNFRKSHTCGSLFAKCSCRVQSLTPLNDDNIPKVVIGGGVNWNNSRQSNDGNRCDSFNCARFRNYSESDKKSKKLFQSYSHPDTAFIFTDENKNPTTDGAVRGASSIITKSGRVEIKHPKRLSSPNIGNYTILDVAVHPEILVKISKKNYVKQEPKSSEGNVQSADRSRPRLRRSEEECGSTDSENSVDVLGSINGSSTSGRDHLNSPEPCQFDLEESFSDIEGKEIPENGNITANSKCPKHNRISQQQELPLDFIDPAQKFFLESGILGPIGSNSVGLIRKTSKIMQDPSLIEQIRKNSKLLRNSPEIRKVNDDMEYVRGLTHNLKLDTKQEREEKIRVLEEQVTTLKETVSSRDNEILKLRREIHKLKSVLQQTTNHMSLADGDLLSCLQTQRCMPGQQSQVTSSCPNTKIVNNIISDKQLYPGRTDSTNCANKEPKSTSDDCKGRSFGTSSYAATTAGPHQLPAHLSKKQGVSGESCDSASHQANNLPIPKFDKDFKSKQLIKDAIMDNDFLKNIDSSQVRELVESMYSLDVPKGEYVIREGEAGAHLYVSAEGKFEVIKNGAVLGEMGPGKAFGELAILYNCTRTASIRVLCESRVWVLDRRVFQQIMMRTGLQRIEDNVNFLKSVPLLKNLSNDVLAKIADVLEVEFYPSGAYIIRQGARGDTFFLIRQGTVKVTQKISASTEEKEIRTLGRGDYFGEQALINEDKRTANIIALDPGVECLTLDRESFTHLIGNLCELKEKNYGDANRFRTIENSQNKSEKVFGSEVKQELLDLKLSDLEVVATLGIGGFGRVELVKCYRDNKMHTYALKCLKKKHIIDTRQEEHVFSERIIMLCCNTPFICRLYRTFRDSKYVYMLLEACMGGEVWTILRDRGNFDENTTQFIIGCVLHAFEYLHSRGIIYRDLKPENLMLNERGYVKLVDFGFAKYIGPSNKTWTFCGTPEYVAPEIILNKGHDRAVDYWALGILMHELLTGTPPFTANDPMKTYNIILKGIDMVDFPKHLSRSAIMLIKKLCRDVPAERLGYQKGGIQDIKKHKWFQGFDWDGLGSLALIPPFLRPVSHVSDTCYFDRFPVDTDQPPDELSGWDADF